MRAVNKLRESEVEHGTVPKSIILVGSVPGVPVAAVRPEDCVQQTSLGRHLGYGSIIQPCYAFLPTNIRGESGA